MREQSIHRLMAQGLSETLAESCVNLAGEIDTEKVSTIRASMLWARNPASLADPGLIQALKDALKEAKARKDMGAQINLRSRLCKMGVLNPEI
jgi:hypothetical protein